RVISATWSRCSKWMLGMLSLVVSLRGREDGDRYVEPAGVVEAYPDRQAHTQPVKRAVDQARCHPRAVGQADDGDDVRGLPPSARRRERLTHHGEGFERAAALRRRPGQVLAGAERACVAWLPVRPPA